MAISLISNPPYNLRWKAPQLAGFLPQYAGYEIPPDSNANMAFILSALYRIEDRAVILLPNGVLTSNQKQEQSIRRQLISQNLMLAVISLPSNMFESTNIPTCLLVFDKHKETRRIAMIDLTDKCDEEVRNQRGQFGGASHEGRTYHKTVKVVSDSIINKCTELINNGKDEEGFCRWVSPEEITDWDLTPKRYFEFKTEFVHREFADIASDYNRIIAQKNSIQIKMNKTVAKRLGYDCMAGDKPDVTESFVIVGQKADKEKNITFSADDGITIRVSTKDGIHPLILDFLNHWRQMIMYLNNEENRYLAEFRDALLPDLISGKIEEREDG